MIPITELFRMTKKDAAKMAFGVEEETKREIYALDKPISGRLTLDYPLTKPYVLEYKDVATVGELSWLIAQAYGAIYETEDETSKVRVIDEEARGMVLNRNQTDGEYGIWGHDMSDLFLEIINIDKKGNSKVFIGS